jgi:hypothetical protein
MPVNAGLAVGALLLNVVQSVEVKYPLTLVLAAAILITGVVVPVATETGAVPETEVTVPAFVALIVWLGQVPVTVTFVPATMAGVVVPVPPLATASVPATVTAPAVAVLGVNPVEPKLRVDTPSTTLDATFT